MKELIERILNLLEKNHIETYLINENHIESVELFFIKKKLDIRREKDIKQYNLTVYHDFEKDEMKMRGSSTVSLYSQMSDEELHKTIEKAYFAASFVCNPYYELPMGEKKPMVAIESSLAKGSLAENAGKITEALFSEDKEQEVFINSAEIFMDKATHRIVNSNGIDVGYEKYTVKGEFIAQCITPQDVETYHDFSYDSLNTSALKAKVKEALELTKARALAKMVPVAGEYTVLLSGAYVIDIFMYYLSRSSADMIYPKYSSYQVGDFVQGEDVTGELLNITLAAKEPYSSEGIPMIDRPLYVAGELKVIHGNSRYSYYLNLEPTGSYHGFSVPAGTVSLADMKSGKYLHVVAFSDFQMDAFSGHFGGEIRLAFLSDGETITPVTGGSINGSILDVQKNLIFSKDMQTERDFYGPFAVKLEKVSVAGA